MATIKDVAKLAGVAVSTASYALNHNSRVNAETAKRVLEAAKTLNYQKNGIARDLKRSKTETIGIIVQDLSGPFYSELMRGVQDTLLTHQYGLIACSSIGGNVTTASKFLQERRVDGVIILAESLPDELILGSVREDFPIIVLDRKLDSDSIIHVLVDNFSGGYQATQHLIDLGHKKLAYIGGPSHNRDNQLRFEGYKQALKDSCITLHPSWILQGQYTREGGYSAAKILMMQGNAPSAVFCANDEMAVGALKAFKESGLHIPDDLSIIGFDDIEISQYISPPLSTVKQSNYEIGSLAAHLIYQALNEGIEGKDYILPTELVLRKSTSAAKKMEA
ncbi:LacI family DNA-binding transcriptional regulator [Peribacillus frigoritolerans]|uniref:LacI family DNA-binding transcriptional regulator n=1 Tax=Peribacillus frigoritolerans TaxID=450367 RepID=UPI001059D7C0|nr:LacI family DNA-binding transcriptional regulator [Peribacillus frigoritolerans]TDL80283.1 LacI family transcriptional regulator [Peribacillus frigoritolerans]